MQLESKKYLFDIKQAAGLLADFTRGKSFTDFQGDPIDDRLVWGVLDSKLPTLSQEVKKLLE